MKDETPFDFESIRSAILETQRLELARGYARARARAALEQHDWSAPAARPRVMLRRFVGGACAAAAVTTAVLLILGHRSSVLTFRYPGGSGAARSGEIMAPAESDWPVTFSDGSIFTLERGSGLRVVDTSRTGARILLQRGGLSASVAHGRRSRWSVGAGPFTVTVTGTKFHVAWDAGAGAFALEVTEGSVIVEGELLRGGRPVVAGHRLRVALRERRVTWDGDGVPAADAHAAARTSAASAPVDTFDVRADQALPGPVLAPRPSGASRPRGATWKDLILAERYAAAIRQTEAQGFSRVCRDSASADLVLLGNAARYAGSLERAAEAFTAVRRRFPGTSEAAVAAFALGRMAHDNQHRFAEAARWLEIYLAEMPTGELAREAAGRLVEARWKSDDRDGATAAAQGYLTNHPNGPHSGLARSILAR